MPWSHTIVSGTITGRAAACASRCVELGQPAVRQHRPRHPQRLDPARAASAPGSSPGPAAARRPPPWWSGAAPPPASVRVARSISQVSSTRSTSPSSSTTRTSSGVESICVHSPGRTAVTVPNGPSGRLANDRRVRAEPKVCRPRGDLLDQPVERRPRRHRRRVRRARRAGSAPPAGGAGRPCRSTGRSARRPPGGPPRRPARRPGRSADGGRENAAVHQPQQPSRLVAEPQPLQRAQRTVVAEPPPARRPWPVPAAADVRVAGSYSGLGMRARGRSGGTPVRTSTMCRSHQRACSTTSSGRPSNTPAGGNGRRDEGVDQRQARDR